MKNLGGKNIISIFLQTDQALDLQKAAKS
jgi:hypothetical protein